MTERLSHTANSASSRRRSFESETIRRSSDVRMLIGLANLLSPDAMVSPFVKTPLDAREQTIVRILGARQLLQGALTRSRPGFLVFVLGAEVDFLHVLSMIALSKMSSRWRKPAGLDCVIGVALILSEVRALTSGPRHTPAGPFSIEGNAIEPHRRN